MKKSLHYLALLLFSIFSSTALMAQKDSLLLNNGNTIVGEIKGMTKGVLQIETPYSDADFTIEIEGIKEIYSSDLFMFSTEGGKRVTGSFSSDESGNIIIKTPEGQSLVVPLDSIVFIQSLDQGFLSRLYANIDVGYSLAKANNQQQLTGNLRLGYLSDFWSIDMYYNTLYSTQDQVDLIQRNDAGLQYRYFLPRNWFVLADITFLSNTEQNLDLRTTGKVGAGNFVIRSNQAYWAFSGGVAFNGENFNLVSTVNMEDSIFTQQSYEGFIGTELNLYDIGDLNLLTNITAYPSFTESGRWRSDFRFDAKYDDFLIEDFYIRAGFTVNYDNQPAQPGREVDYVFTTGFGWEW